MSDLPLAKRSIKMTIQRPEGGWQLRVFHRKTRGGKGPRLLIKCGCCEESVEIYYGDNMLEINGVMGSCRDWSEVLLPLLAESPTGAG